MSYKIIVKKRGVMKTVTIMKYRIGNKYFFKVLDKFDIKDAAERLDEMIQISKQLEKENKDYEQLWIKETVLF
jgi:hypothetical protein